MGSIAQSIKKSIQNGLKLLKFQLQFLSFEKEPAKSFRRSKSIVFLTYDRAKFKFNEKISLWKRIISHHYYKVYYNNDNQIIGYKLISRKGFIKLITQVQRIYSPSDLNHDYENGIENKEIFQSDIRLDLVLNFTKSAILTQESDVFLWQMRKQYDIYNPFGKEQFFYSNEEFIIEYLEKFHIRGIFVEGSNTSLQKILKSNQYIRKIKDFDGTYRGFDELQRGKIKNSLRLFFNEDGVLILTDRFALVNEKRQLREISRYDSLGNKINSELYEDEKLQKSAVFFYNEDRKLVKIIQYGPDGSVIS